MRRIANIQAPSKDVKKEIASVLKSIKKLEDFIDESEFVPATADYRGIVILALLSKCLTVGRAICALVKVGFPEEAFGLSRTLIDIYLTVRYISNKDTEIRAERFAEFFMKNHESWASIIPKFYPQLNVSDSPEHRIFLETAKKYKNPHDWSGEPYKTKSLAMEPDTYEFDATGNGTKAEFDYEVIFKLTSHFVHSTVSALESHFVERGDTFKVRGRWEERKGSKSLFHVLVFVSKTFVCGFRALHQDQPEDILQRMHQQMQSY
jgi:hypothetical protein